MSHQMNQTPSSVRIQIGFYGRRNVGKSSLINALTGQKTAIVSEIKGTTTDPVYKAMELLPLGACLLIDTAGLDDEGEIGALRMEKTLHVLNKTDIAVLVMDATDLENPADQAILKQLREKKLPVVVALNKSDLVGSQGEEKEQQAQGVQAAASFGAKAVSVSAQSGVGIKELKEAIIQAAPHQEDQFRIVGDLLTPGDFVVLVTPIDKAAPKGRLILPQQQVIRDVLESDGVALVTKEHELRQTLAGLRQKPRMVITDSQAFLKAAADTPPDVLLTSFSILFARYKGDLNELVRGAAAIGRLKNGDRILISEACTHHQQADDIGKVKIPRWLRQATGKALEFEFAQGTAGNQEDLSRYALIVHCGACMLNRAGMMHRIEQAKANRVPIVNYGVLIACVQGILDRVLAPFPLAKMIWEECSQ